MTTLQKPTLALVASTAPEAVAGAELLHELYTFVPVADADIIVALGGDGFMLQTLHTQIEKPTPIYGMNRGTVGFLMNEFEVDDLYGRLALAEKFTLNPLKMTAISTSGNTTISPAFNEVSLLRETRQVAKLEITIDGKVRMEELMADGVLVATPAGSTAYNLSADGPILPLESDLLALTPISAFRPRRWRGALLPKSSKIEFRILESAKRPVSVVADQLEVRDVVSVTVETNQGLGLHLLFDPGQTLAERILSEQFEV